MEIQPRLCVCRSVKTSSVNQFTSEHRAPLKIAGVLAARSLRPSSTRAYYFQDIENLLCLVNAHCLFSLRAQIRRVRSGSAASMASTSRAVLEPWRTWSHLLGPCLAVLPHTFETNAIKEKRDTDSRFPTLIRRPSSTASRNRAELGCFLIFGQGR